VAQKLTANEIEGFRRELLARLTVLYREVRQDLREAMLRHLFAQDEPRDEGDESLRTQLRDLTTTLDEREGRLAQAIEAALERIARGTFGVCVDCGQPIERGRLRLLPWAARCLDDQQALESATQARPPSM
jgi:DnaK suppressor protein